MEEIIKRCNLVNMNIGSIARTADILFGKTVLTTGGYILTISDQHIQDQNANSLANETIEKIVQMARKV